MILKSLYYSFPKKVRNYIYKNLGPIVNDVENEFIYSESGKHYGLNKNDRINIVNRIVKILANVKSATNLNVHLTLIKRILEIPLNKENSYLVEAGCYYGATSCTMSIAAKILNKKLIIYDSFLGLPDDDEKELKIYDHLKVKGYYKKGMYSGPRKKVENSIKKYGEFDKCIFREGAFEHTMKDHSERICFLFIDVDLKSSTKTTISYLWPYVSDNHYIYTDDSCDLGVVKLWFDDNWWIKKFSCSSPGYVGSGCGLPINGIGGEKYSSLGYVIKNIEISSLQAIKWLKKNNKS
jgi:hypothetical protein